MATNFFHYIKYTMNTEALFLFLILLLGLILCSLLGGNCGKEGFNGMSNTFTAQNGSTAVLNPPSNNQQTLTVVMMPGQSPLTFSGSASSTTFTGPDGATATITTTNGQRQIQVKASNGLVLNTYTQSSSSSSSSSSSGSTFTSQNGGTAVLNPPSNNQQTLTVIMTPGQPPLTFSGSASSTTFTGPSGSIATITTTNGQRQIQVKTSNGMVLDTFTQSGSSTTNSSSSYDNYNHYTASSSSSSGSTFTSQNGGTVVLNPPSNNQQTLTVVMTPGQPPLTFSGSASSTTFTGPSGSTATITTVNGKRLIQVKTSNGMVLDTFTQSGTTTNTTSSTKYYGSTGSPIQPSDYSLAYQGTAGVVTGPHGNSAYYAQGPHGNSVAGMTSSGSGYGNQYNDSLPQGIPRSQIPPGNEDLYILKSQVVPPVCPVCPVGAACPRQEKCPPCPACARCPEPAFECKKIPNYNAINNDQLPLPVLNDFSSFGM